MWKMGFSVLVVVVSCSGPKQACGLGRLGFCVGSVAAGVVRARNPRLVAGVFQWGYIEELGLGVDRMIESMVQEGHPPPHFKARPHAFAVTLHNSRDRKVVPKWESNMNERQMRALTHVRELGRIANREYRQLCPDVSPETLRLDLADLVSKGALLKIGAKRGTYYILK